MFGLGVKEKKVLLVVLLVLCSILIKDRYFTPKEIFIEDYIARYNRKEAKEIAYYILLYSKEHQIPPEVATGIFLQESKFNNQAISRVGAIGISQLMPETAEEMGVNPKILHENIQGGIAYYKKMLDFNDGDVSKALASYNAGYGNVEEYNGIPPFPETENYVQRVLRHVSEIKKEKIIFEMRI